MRVNMIGTYYALEAALATKDTVERMLEFSTSEVFGTHAFNVGEGQVTDDRVGQGGALDLRGFQAGGRAPVACLLRRVRASHRLGAPVQHLRPGPDRRRRDPRLHRGARCDGRDLTIHGDGSQIRAWCYVDDMVEGTLLGLEHPNAVGESFNIGNARSAVTIYDLARRIKALSGAKGEIVFTPLDYVDVELRIPNMGKARELLGFEAQVELDEGLERTIDWFRTNRPTGT